MRSYDQDVRHILGEWFYLAPRKRFSSKIWFFSSSSLLSVWTHARTHARTPHFLLGLQDFRKKRKKNIYPVQRMLIIISALNLNFNYHLRILLPELEFFLLLRQETRSNNDCEYCSKNIKEGQNRNREYDAGFKFSILKSIFH